MKPVALTGINHPSATLNKNVNEPLTVPIRQGLVYFT